MEQNREDEKYANRIKNKTNKWFGAKKLIDENKEREAVKNAQLAAKKAMEAHEATVKSSLTEK